MCARCQINVIWDFISNFAIKAKYWGYSQNQEAHISIGHGRCAPEHLSNSSIDYEHSLAVEATTFISSIRRALDWLAPRPGDASCLKALLSGDYGKFHCLSVTHRAHRLTRVVTCDGGLMHKHVLLGVIPEAKQTLNKQKQYIICTNHSL